MADNKLLQQMLESLVNDDQAKAEELFHDYVVQQSREIYESMIDSEIAEEEEKDEEDEEVEEASDEEDKEEDKVEENFEDMAYEGDDEMDLDSEDPTDDLAGELGGEEGEESEEGEEQLFQDLEAIVDELQAKFDELKGVEGDEHGDEMGDDEGGNPFAKQEGIDDLETVREYVEKVPAGHGAEKKGQAEKADGNGGGLKFNKNDMGGTSLKFGQEGGSDKGTAGGLANNKPTDNPDAKGNVNVPGGNAGKTGFKTKEPGHGAEKAGSKESADNKQSLFRGRR
jgi:hypothetical protein